MFFSKDRKQLLNCIEVFFFNLADALIPLPLRKKTALQQNPNDAKKIHDTGYLDGFRGTVAFLVFVRHYSLPWQPDLDYGFHHGYEHTGIWRLPVLRMFYSGPNVPVMLVVSGFVLSLKPLRLMRNAEWDKLFFTASSSALRRAGRIFPPPIISTALVCIAVQLGLFNFPYSMMPGKVAPHPLHLGFWQQIGDWSKFVIWELTNPWTWKSIAPAYGAHLWTIPLQLRCSMLVTLLLIALGRTRVRSRRLIAVSLLIYTFCMGRWDVSTYLGGLLIADVRMQNRQSDVIDSSQKDWKPLRKSRFHRIIVQLLITTTGLYLGSFPRQIAGKGAPGYQWVTSISRDYHTWHACGAILLVIAVCLSSTAQKAFNCAPARYLGKISFSLYIVHEPLLHIYGYRCTELAWRLTGVTTILRYQLGFCLGFMLTLPVVLYIADLFYRCVDQPCERITRRLDEYLNRPMA